MAKEIHFPTWEALKKAVPEYERLGYKCAVRGWDGMSNNTLIIEDALEDMGDYPGVIPDQFDNMTGSMNL